MKNESDKSAYRKIWNYGHVKSIRYLGFLGLIVMGRAIWQIIESDRVSELGPIIIFFTGLFMFQQYRLRAELTAVYLLNKEK